MQSTQNITNNLARQDYWDSAYAGYELAEAGDDQVTEWIRKYIPVTANGTCLEIGCFPGRYLVCLGKLGYEVNGVDLTPRVENEFPAWLKRLGLKVGEFKRQDFFEYAPSQKYDLVSSFGFIEHFQNWEDVLLKHMSLVKKGGYLLIETPNFKGWMQRLIHYYLDKKNYDRHFIPAMDPAKWSALCEKNGFEILWQGYLGDFQFWIDEEPKGFRSTVFKKLNDWTHRLKKLPPGKKAYAPFCGMVARKIS
jgi:2-polyprenyl-3-methyl-5-hydroxy-6-metoxy-1,4-benzoquinol methylase